MDPVARGLGARALARNPPGNKVIPLGDSIVLAGTTWGWAEVACALSNGRFLILRNAGVNGNTSSQMLARFDADVGAYLPGQVWISGSVNNIGASISNAQMISDYRQMIAKCRAINARPIIVACAPYNTQPSTIQTMNRLLNQLAASEGISFINPWLTTIDTSNGHWASGYNVSDGTHPNFIAQRMAGEEFIRQMDALPVFCPNLPIFSGDTGSLASNGLFLNGSSTPTGWTVDAAFTPTLTAGTGDVLGNWFNLAFASLAAYKTADLTMSTTGISLGDRLQMICRVKSSGFEANGNGPAGVGLGACDVKIYLRGTSFNMDPYPQPSLSCDLTSGVHHTLGRVVDQVPASLTVRIAIGNRSGTPSGTLSIAQLGVYNLGQ